MPLSQAEIIACREAFAKFDKDGSGSIDAAKLKAMFTSMGQTPTDEELFLMISQVDEDNSGALHCSNLFLSQLLEFYSAYPINGLPRKLRMRTPVAGEIEFAEFLLVFERQKEAMARLTDETDTLDAYVALGGGTDKSGFISAEKLSKLCKVCCAFLDTRHFRTYDLAPPWRLLAYWVTHCLSHITADFRRCVFFESAFRRGTL